ncbi:MAG: DUF3861 domain-containing protein [Janthinobacterium lividum]
MTKKAHHYHLHLTSAAETPDTAPPQTLDLAFSNHDDLFAILARVQERNLFDESTTAEFVVGLKLLSEVVLKNRKHLLFSELKDDLSAFMQKLKATNTAPTDSQGLTA